MKNIYLFICAGMLMLTSCLKEALIDPVASFEVYEITTDENGIESTTKIQLPASETDTVTVTLGNTLKFINTGAGTHFSLWTGDNNHDYYNDGSNESGFNFPVDEDGFEYSYSAEGVYNVIMWATTLEENAESWDRTSVSYIFKVVTE